MGEGGDGDDRWVAIGPRSRRTLPHVSSDKIVAHSPTRPGEPEFVFRFGMGLVHSVSLCGSTIYILY